MLYTTSIIRFVSRKFSTTQKIYLETSIFNFVFSDDVPDKKSDTLKLFEEIKLGKYEPYTSAYVVGELEAASQPKQDSMLKLIPQFRIKVLPKNDSIVLLAQNYVAKGIIPEKYVTDAYHIATATVNELDIIASWNFKHIFKMKTVKFTEVVNIEQGYKKILIHSPTEVIE